MNPVEEFLFHKESMSPEVKSAIQLGAIAAGTTALAAVGTAQLQAGIQSAQDAVSKSVAFKKMMVDNPNLNKMDGKKARRYFDTLYRTAPELAKDPFAAGSWVQKVNEYDYVDPQSLNTLAQTGAKLRERQTQQLMPAFQLAQGAVQTGVGEYSRLQDQAVRQAQEDARQELAKNKFKYEKRRDIIKGIAAFGKDLGEATRRKEDQQFKLLEEMRAGARKQWELEHSPKAYGVKTPQDMEAYTTLRNKKTWSPQQGFEPHPDAPRPYPGSAGWDKRGPEEAAFGQGITAKSGFERMMEAITKRFGK